MTEEQPAVARAIVIKDTQATQRALVSRFGERDFGQALSVSMFIALCNKYELNPWMGHITPFEGRPYIQHDGWLHLINREAPGQLIGLESRPATEEEYKLYRIDAGDYFAVAVLIRRWPNGNEITLTRRALIPARLTAPSSNEARGIEERPGTAKTRPLVADPWDMAEKQARVRVMRMSFNDVLGGVAPAASPEEPQVDRETGEIIEGEAVAPTSNGLDWSRLWVIASEAGMDHAAVHQFFNVPPHNGALRDLVYARAGAAKTPPVQIVSDMADELEASVRRPDRPEEEGPDQAEEEAQASALSEEPVDESA